MINKHTLFTPRKNTTAHALAARPPFGALSTGVVVSRQAGWKEAVRECERVTNDIKGKG